MKTQSSEIKAVFDAFPDQARKHLLDLRKLIQEAAQGSVDIGSVEESEKWGEPSYHRKNGSMVRLGWNKKYPDRVGIYFNCNTTLVDTFREVYAHLFTFEGNRVILFQLGEPIEHASELKHCIGLSLRYHKIKHLPLLGV